MAGAKQIAVVIGESLGFAANELFSLCFWYFEVSGLVWEQRWRVGKCDDSSMIW
jgi:hypothetical protein